MTYADIAMKATSHSPLTLLMARLAASLPFIITVVVVGILVGGIGEAVLAVRVGYWIALAVVVIVGFAASHFAYGHLESHIVTAMSIALPALLASKISPLLFAIPGALAGFMAALAVVGVMDRPNRQAAEMERRDKQNQKIRDVA